MSKHPDDAAIRDDIRDAVPCERVDEWLEPYIDGELDPWKERLVEKHIQACAECAAEAGLARRVRSGLRGLPSQTCPDRVVDTVLQETGLQKTGLQKAPQQKAPPAAPVSIRSLRPVHWWRPALALAAMLFLAVSLPRLVDTLSTDPHPAPSAPSNSLPELAATPSLTPELPPDEVARAEAEVKLALAYLGRFTAETRHTVGYDVLGKKVVLPMSRSLRGIITADGTSIQGGGNAS